VGEHMVDDDLGGGDVAHGALPSNHRTRNNPETVGACARLVTSEDVIRRGRHYEH
jgi:hypothetical protein